MAAAATALPTTITAAPQRTRHQTGPVLRATDYSLGLVFVWFSLPETITAGLTVAGVPFRFVLFYFAVLHYLTSMVARGTPPFGSTLVRISVLGMVGMASLGWLAGNDYRFWVIDTTNYAGLALGLHWATHRNLRQITVAFASWLTVLTTVLVLNLAGLVFGYIPQASEGSRVYSYSLFNSTSFLLTMFPFWRLVPRQAMRGSSLTRLAPLFTQIAIGSVAFAAVLSASRSMLIGVVASVMILFWLQARGKHAPLWILLSAGGLLATQAMLLSTDGWRQANLTERLSATSIAEEARYVEVVMMIEDLEGRLLTGRGFGSRFYSCIGVEGDLLAYAPHIGVLTLLFKGGVFALVIGVVVPLAIAFWVIVRRREGEHLRRVACAGILLYGIQASMSGGWGPMPLFLYGSMISLAWRAKPQRKRTNRRPPSNAPQPNPRGITQLP